jgi:phage gpG-like protein
VPELSGRDLLNEWQRVMQAMVGSAASVAGQAGKAGKAEIPAQLLEPMQRQLELVQELIERERRLQREVASRLAAPVDAVFDLLEESAETLTKQAEALAAAGRALEDSADLVRTQAELFERTVAVLRQPTELAKTAAGVERRPRKGRARSKPRA